MSSFRGSEATEESKTDRFFADAQNDGKRAAFTLAETMIVLVILGIVAAITVPALVRNQMEVQNRTRLRKAMTVYDMAINKMVVENNFKDTKALTDWANGNNCVNTREYFKIVQDGKNGCIFSTSGGLWWNISDITKPIVGFNEDDIEAANSTTSFQLFGHFGENGELRIDDLAYEQVADFLSYEEKQLLADLYNFVNNVKEEDTRTDFQKNCVAINETQCKIGDTIYTKKSIEKTTVDKSVWDTNLCIQTEEEGQKCPYTSTAEKGDYYFTKLNIDNDKYNKYAEENGQNYHKAAELMCNEVGGSLPTIAELQAGGYTSGYFWASEIYSGEKAIVMHEGQVGFFDIDTRDDVVCVGK